MSEIFVPTRDPDDWQRLLAEPDKQWKTGFSAKTLACCWLESDGFPQCVKSVFKKSEAALFRDAELLLAIPEHQVPLPPYGAHPSQNDLFALARGNGQLISITVEGKVSEPFGPTVAEWRKEGSNGKKVRLAFLLDKLRLENNSVDTVRYQLLHRTASAMIEAERFTAPNALMLVHSFSESDKWSKDYANFLSLFDLVGEPDLVVGPRKTSGVDLFFGWVRGDRQYLKR